jgi:hypothetical protein
MIVPDPALEPTAASAIRLAAVPTSLRSSAAARRERYAARETQRLEMPGLRPGVI